MESDLQEIQKIMVRFILDEATEEERKLLDAWCCESDKNRVFFQETCTIHKIRAKLTDYAGIDPRMAYKLNQSYLRKRRIRRVLWRALPYAAIFLIGFSIHFLWSRQPIAGVQQSEPTGIVAGCRQAELILANGEKVQLAEGMEVKVREGQSEIIISGNKVHYGENNVSRPDVCNTIRTPLGGEYSVILSDGTVVWLNALSELKYPVKFAENDRCVELKGEAYFEVKKDQKRPFIVSVDRYRIRVLGTAFNINAYADQSILKTTLCTGKVQVSDVSESNKQMVLIPGQQLLCDRESGRMRIENVNTDLFTAWTKGFFRFENNTVEDIFVVLKRWYNIDVTYADQRVKQELFTGKLPRFDRLQVILDLMKRVSDLKFEVKGQVVYVK